MTGRVAGLLVLLSLASMPRAQDRSRVRVVVTGVAGRSVFLDQGRAAGLAPGDRVELQPPGTAPFDATVRSVSTGSARAELPPGVLPPPVGTPGECEVHRARTTPETAPRRAGEAPDHPGWTSEERGFDPDAPLLAPARGTRPADRPTHWSGRAYAQMTASRDRAGSRASDWFVGRLGARATATNPFGGGGALELGFDLDRRGTDLADSGSETNTRLRIERLSYTYGLEARAPVRAQVGRFVSSFVPELGLLDGVEGALRSGEELSFGAFAGALPLPFPARASGEDVGGHAFVEFASKADHRLTAALAFQKTWHEGAPDRDLLVMRASVRPARDLYAWFSSKLDFYGSSAQAKDSGVELTELFTSLRWAPPTGVGGSLSYSHFKWPELRRREYENLPVELLARGRIDRASASAWAPVVEGIRVRGRASWWGDQDDSGASWELSTELDGIVEERTWIEARVFRLDGSFSTGPGFGLDVRRSWDAFQGHLGYQQRDFDQRGLLAGAESFTSRSIRGGLQWFLGGWSVDLNADWFFGDDEDAVTLSLFGQYTF